MSSNQSMQNLFTTSKFPLISCVANSMFFERRMLERKMYIELN